MVLADQTSRASAPRTTAEQHVQRHQNLPSPALCCACGLCIMLAGINITLVGAFAFSTFVPTENPPIVIGPLLLLLALVFFSACCLVGRRPPAHMVNKIKNGESWGLVGMGTAAFELETSEHTLQDTTAVQFSPTNSHNSSHEAASALRFSQDEAAEMQISEVSDLCSNSPKETTSTLLQPDPVMSI